MTKPKEDLVGRKFGKLTVAYQAEDYIEKSGKHRTKWHCICECGNEKDVLEKTLRNGMTKSCGCYKIGRNIIDLTNERFGRLLVLEKSDRRKVGKQYVWYWKCICDCGEICYVSGTALRNGDTKSCGCLRKEITSQSHKKYNEYDLSGEYGVGYTTSGEEFYFDLEDYDLIKNYCWYKRKNGYIVSNAGNKNVHMHRLIMGLGNNDTCEVDHKKEFMKHDNRKSNLRIATKSENMRNVGIRKNNTSGITGVDWMKKNQKWRARICVDKKQFELGYFDEFEKAVDARKRAENKYFGEWSYDDSNKTK